MNKIELTSFADLAADKRKVKEVFFNQINSIIDWEKIDQLIKRHYNKGVSAVGRPSYSGLLLFKITLLQTWYNLSDYEVEDQVNDRISFSKFLGLSLEDNCPDHSVISRFRTEMTKRKVYDKLLEEIREIRLSERMFYQKITDIYATSVDYNKDDETTKKFFAKVQNKLHFAIHGHTAAELIYNRADSQKEHMGLTTWDNAPDGKILRTDVTIAKNYLSKDELDSLGRIVNAFLDLAENRAKRNIPMTMEDWAKRLDAFLEFDDREILQDNGKITKKIADEKAFSEFEKYRIVQDRLFMSDFDKLLLNIKNDSDD